ncbi:MAG: hypothetical protein ACE37F_00910 [Nannocystaceae bacterium]|nr:hypothetical protein [bacterium]
MHPRWALKSAVFLSALDLLTACAEVEPDDLEVPTAATETDGTTIADAGDSGPDHDSSSGTSHGITDNGTTGNGTTSGSADLSTGEGVEESSGNDPTPTVPPGAYIRGTIELLDRPLVDFDVPSTYAINSFTEQHVCEAETTIDGNEYEVELLWPDTNTLEIGKQSWSPLSTDGPQLRVSVHGRVGSESSLSTAGWVHFVDVGDDDPPTVAGVAHIDLAGPGRDDILQSMTDIEFRCPLD